MSRVPSPPIAPVRIRGAHASLPGVKTTSLPPSNNLARVLVERDAGLAALASCTSSELDSTGARAAEMVVDSCSELFRGRRSSIRDELAEIWWLGEHGEDREGAGRRAPRPYSTLPIADRVELRERIGALLETRIAESMGDIAVLEAETASLLAIPQRALVRAGADLYRRAEADRRWRGTSAGAVCVLFAAGRASIAHIADNRVSRIRDGELEALTTEHSLRNHYRKAQPDASEETLASYPANVYTRMLGVSDVVEPETTEVPVEAGDIFVLTNRGANELFSAMELLTTVRGRGRGAAEYLVKRATNNPHGFGVEVVVVEVV